MQAIASRRKRCVVYLSFVGRLPFVVNAIELILYNRTSGRDAVITNAKINGETVVIMRKGYGCGIRKRTVYNPVL